MNQRTVASLEGWGLLPLRVAVGTVFLMHGGQKLLVYGLAGTRGAMAQMGIPLPQVAAANVKTQWMPDAKFDHDAHRGFSCVSCHAKALTSTEASDILLPGIAVCKTCHGPGADHADSRCSECHTYHDWSTRREVTPKFTLPALPTGGQ